MTELNPAAPRPKPDQARSTDRPTAIAAAASSQTKESRCGDVKPQAIVGYYGSRAHANPRREGYLLLSVLLVMVLCGLLFAAFANHSLEFVTNVHRRADALRDKWARAGCMQVGQHLAAPMLRNGPTQTDIENETSRSEPTAIQLQLSLNETTYQVSVENESTKLDVNYVFAKTSGSITRRIINDTVDDHTSETPLRAALRPLDPAWQDLKNDPFECWGQVFERRDRDASDSDIPSHRYAHEFLLAKVTPRLTLWGQAVNYHVASEKVVHTAVELGAGSIMADRFCEQLHRDRHRSLPEMLLAIDANQGQAKQIRRAVTEQTRAVSIRVNRADRRGPMDWLIIEKYGENIVRERSMVWE